MAPQDVILGALHLGLEFFNVNLGTFLDITLGHDQVDRLTGCLQLDLVNPTIDIVEGIALVDGDANHEAV